MHVNFEKPQYWLILRYCILYSTSTLYSTVESQRFVCIFLCVQKVREKGWKITVGCYTMYNEVRGRNVICSLVTTNLRENSSACTSTIYIFHPVRITRVRPYLVTHEQTKVSYHVRTLTSSLTLRSSRPRHYSRSRV